MNYNFSKTLIIAIAMFMVVFQSSCDKLVRLNLDYNGRNTNVTYNAGDGESGKILTQLYNFRIDRDSIFRVNKLDRGEIEEVRLLTFKIEVVNPEGGNFNNIKSFRALAGFLNDDEDRVVIADEVLELEQNYVELKVKEFSLMNFITVDQPSAIFLEADVNGAFANGLTILAQTRFQVRVSGQSRR
jgi:hypothetical protein